LCALDCELKCLGYDISGVSERVKRKRLPKGEKNVGENGVIEREKIVLNGAYIGESVCIIWLKYNISEKDQNHFDVLPEGWIKVTHESGIPVYLHRKSRVCTVSRPYSLGTGSVRVFVL
jgi:hypothetical protein